MSDQAANAVGAAPSARRRPSHESIAEVVLTVLLGAFFAWAYLESTQWPYRAALFPSIITALSFFLCVLHLVKALFRLRLRSARTPELTLSVDDSGENLEPDDGQGFEEDTFRRAVRRQWVSTSSWMTAFFVLLYVGGLFITAPLFSFFYLRFAGRQTWILSAVYAVVVGAVLYAIFELLLGVSTPTGLLFS